MSGPNDQAALEAHNDHLLPLNNDGGTAYEISSGVPTSAVGTAQSGPPMSDDSQELQQPPSQQQHHLIQAINQESIMAISQEQPHHHNHEFGSNGQIMTGYAMEGVVLSGPSIHDGPSFVISPTAQQHAEHQQLSQTARIHHTQGQHHQHQKLQETLDEVQMMTQSVDTVPSQPLRTNHPLPPPPSHHHQQQPQALGSLSLSTSPVSQQTILVSAPIVPIDAQPMHPMPFQQTVEIHSAKIHFIGSEEQQIDQHQHVSQVFTNTHMIEAPANPHIAAEAPVLPSQQPPIQPVGVHHHQLSLDGHISPPIDLGLLNVQIQQQQHFQEQLHLHRQQQQQQQQQVQSIMAAAVMASTQQAVLSPTKSGVSTIMMPVSQNIAAMPSTQELALGTSTGITHRDMEAHLMSLSQQQQQPIQHQQQHLQQQLQQQSSLTLPVRMEGDVFLTSLVPSGSATAAETAFANSITSAEPITSLTPMVPSMQSLPLNTTSTSVYTPPDGVIGSMAEPAKRHRRHPSSGHHSPDTRIMFPSQEFFQQQQLKMAAKEHAICENLRRMEAETHQNRLPRTGAAAGLKIDVADIQARAMPPLSALASPAESGQIYSPGPLSGPSPVMGPISNSLMDTITEASSNLRLQNLNDPLPTPVKMETMEVLDLPSTRSELAELSKQELIEKVMEYERQMESSLAMRRSSLPKVETKDGLILSEVPAALQPVSSPVHHLQQPHTLTFSHFPNSPSPSSTPQSLSGAQEAPKEAATEKKPASPQLTTTAVKSSTESTAAVVSSQNDDDDDDDGDEDEEDAEEDAEEDDNDEDVEGGMDSRSRATKRNTLLSGATTGEDVSSAESEIPQQLVCLWRGCNTPFDTMKKLNEHVTDNHIGSGKASYSCDWQGCHRQQKPFTKRHKMYNHLRTHTGERPFKCSVPGCDKKFSRPDSLTTHTKTHSNVRPYVCPVEGCPKAYYHARSLKKHELAHEAKRGGHHRALRGPGSSATTPGSATDSSAVSITPGLANVQSQQQQHSHFSHPYHPDFTTGSSRAVKHGHQRQLSQTASFNMSMASDPIIPAGLLSTGNLSSGTNSPSPGAMVATSGYSPGLNTTTVIKPVMSNHSSTSSIPSLSMVMNSNSMSELDSQGIISINPPFPQQPQNLGMTGMILSPGAAGHHITPTGSPGFQTTVPSTTLTGSTQISTSMNSIGNSGASMTMDLPMAVEMTMSMPMNAMNGHGVDSSPSVLSPLSPTNVNMSMAPIQSTGILDSSNMYGVDPHQQIVSSVIPLGAIEMAMSDPAHATPGGSDQGFVPQPM